MLDNMTDLQACKVTVIRKAFNALLTYCPPEWKAACAVDTELSGRGVERVTFRLRVWDHQKDPITGENTGDKTWLEQKAHIPLAMLERTPDGEMIDLCHEIWNGAFKPQDQYLSQKVIDKVLAGEQPEA